MGLMMDGDGIDETEGDEEGGGGLDGIPGVGDEEVDGIDRLKGGDDEGEGEFRVVGQDG